MSIDLSALSIEDLQTVIADAQRLIKAKKKSQIKDARTHIQKAAAELGFTLDELFAGKTSEDEVPVKARKPVEIRYRNPANAQETWTGRGKQPRWLASAIASGKPLADFLI